MGTARQTANPRVSDIAGSILQRAPTGLSVLEVEDGRQGERSGGTKKERDRRKRARERGDPFMGQYASVTTCHCVHGRCSCCSCHALDTFHDGTHGSKGDSAGAAILLVSHGED